MATLLQRLLDLWETPVDERDDPEAAFRELYADPVFLNGSPVTVSSLVDRARALQRAFADRTTEVVDHVETPERAVIAFYVRARHVGPLVTPLGTVTSTGRPVEIRTIDVLKIDDELVTEIWVVSDELGVLAQLDAVRLVGAD